MNENLTTEAIKTALRTTTRTEEPTIKQRVLGDIVEACRRLDDISYTLRVSGIVVIYEPMRCPCGGQPRLRAMRAPQWVGDQIDLKVTTDMFVVSCDKCNLQALGSRVSRTTAKGNWRWLIDEIVTPGLAAELGAVRGESAQIAHP